MNDTLPARPPGKPQRSFAVRILGALFATIAVGYLALHLHENRNALSAAFQMMSMGAIIMALLAAFTMVMLKALYHLRLLERISGQHGIAREVVPAYCVSQIARYLPGKVWGIAYQSARLSSVISPGDVVTANIAQMVNTNLLAAGVIASILSAVHFSSFWPLLGLMAIAAAVELAHRKPVVERQLIGLLARVSKRNLTAPHTVSPQRFAGTTVLVAEWLAYFVIWLAVVPAGTSPVEIVAVGTWYAAASLLAILAIAVPGGLAVREAIFVALGGLTVMGTANLIVLAATLRIVLTIAELLAVPASMALHRMLPERRDD